MAKKDGDTFRDGLSRVLKWLEELTPTGLILAKNDINDKIRELEELEEKQNE